MIGFIIACFKISAMLGGIVFLAVLAMGMTSMAIDFVGNIIFGIVKLISKILG